MFALKLFAIFYPALLLFTQVASASSPQISIVKISPNPVQYGNEFIIVTNATNVTSNTMYDMLLCTVVPCFITSSATTVIASNATGAKPPSVLSFNQTSCTNPYSSECLIPGANAVNPGNYFLQGCVYQTTGNPQAALYCTPAAAISILNPVKTSSSTTTASTTITVITNTTTLQNEPSCNGLALTLTGGVTSTNATCAWPGGTLNLAFSQAQSSDLLSWYLYNYGTGQSYSGTWQSGNCTSGYGTAGYAPAGSYQAVLGARQSGSVCAYQYDSATFTTRRTSPAPGTTTTTIPQQQGNPLSDIINSIISAIANFLKSL